MLNAQARQLTQLQCFKLKVILLSAFKQIDEFFCQRSPSSVSIASIYGDEDISIRARLWNVSGIYTYNILHGLEIYGAKKKN